MSIEIRSEDENMKPYLEHPVELIELSKLLPHEMTIRSEIEWLIKDLKMKKILIWPILVDKNTNLILDGHHRVFAMKELGYNKIPAHILNYDDEIIKLDTWYPVINISIIDLINILKETSVIVKKVEKNNLNYELLKSRKFTCYVVNEVELYEIEGDRDKIFELIRINFMDKITYYDSYKIALDNTDMDNTCVLAWSYGKDEVRKFAKKGGVYDPKTTRHVLPFKVKKIHYDIVNL
tara:strand:+ start:269 stop:976 length:708 start_codon:yes stop_codon:yes gene_type:complete